MVFNKHGVLFLHNLLVAAVFVSSLSESNPANRTDPVFARRVSDRLFWQHTTRHQYLYVLLEQQCPLERYRPRIISVDPRCQLRRSNNTLSATNIERHADTPAAPQNVLGGAATPGTHTMKWIGCLCGLSDLAPRAVGFSPLASSR